MRMKAKNRIQQQQQQRMPMKRRGREVPREADKMVEIGGEEEEEGLSVDAVQDTKSGAPTVPDGQALQDKLDRSK